MQPLISQRRAPRRVVLLASYLMLAGASACSAYSESSVDEGNAAAPERVADQAAPTNPAEAAPDRIVSRPAIVAPAASLLDAEDFELSADYTILQGKTAPLAALAVPDCFEQRGDGRYVATECKKASTGVVFATSGDGCTFCGGSSPPFCWHSTGWAPWDGYYGPISKNGVVVCTPFGGCYCAGINQGGSCC